MKDLVLLKHLTYKSFIILSIFILSGIILINPTLSQGHTAANIGNLSIEAGWNSEPPFLNQLNHVVIGIEENGSPIRNAFSNMIAVLRYGGIEKNLDFLPSEEVAGLYESLILPTALGSYTIALNGSLNGQNIDTEIPIEDVEDINTIAFPNTENNAEQSALNSGFLNELTEQISSSFSDLEAKIADINSTLSQDIESKIDTEELNSIQRMTNLMFIVSFIGIGAGISGIIIASFALRKTK